MRKLNKIKELALKVALGLSAISSVNAEINWIKPSGTTAFAQDKAAISGAFGIQNAGLVMSVLFNRLAPREASDLLEMAKEIHEAKDNLKNLESKISDLADDVSKAKIEALKQSLATKKQAFFSRMSDLRTKLGQSGIYNRLSVFRRAQTAESTAVKSGFFKDAARRNVIFVIAGLAILTIDAVDHMSELSDLPDVERNVEEVILAESSLNN